MKDYIEYIRQAIIEAAETTTDIEALQLAYGILMNSAESNQAESPTT